MSGKSVALILRLPIGLVSDSIAKQAKGYQNNNTDGFAEVSYLRNLQLQDYHSTRTSTLLEQRWVGLGFANVGRTLTINGYVLLVTSYVHLSFQYPSLILGVDSVSPAGVADQVSKTISAFY